MVISDRLRAIREEKDLSQGDIENRTGLKRCYVSRVENGHTVPSIETLEKMARALEVPLYQLFYDGEAPPEIPSFPKDISADGDEWGSSGESAKFFQRLRKISFSLIYLRKLLVCFQHLFLRIDACSYIQSANDSLLCFGKISFATVHTAEISEGKGKVFLIVIFFVQRDRPQQSVLRFLFHPELIVSHPRITECGWQKLLDIQLFEGFRCFQ